MEDADSVDRDSHKRYSVEEVEENPKKRINKGIVIHLKILIHTNVAGIIIGRGGETIGSIQKDSDAKIKLSKSNEFFPGTQERVCLISGDKESVLAAFCIINNKILDERRTIEGRLRLLVPYVLAGILIGKNGNYITQIKQQCRVKIELSTRRTDKPNYNAAVASTNERILTMGGRQECIEQALTLILDKMVDSIDSFTPILSLTYGNWDHNKLSDGCSNISNKNNPLPFASSSGSMTATVDTPNSNTMNMPMATMGGYDSRALQEISLALGTLAKYGILDLLTATSPTLNMLLSTGANNILTPHRDRRLHASNNNNTSPHYNNCNGGRSSRHSSPSPSRHRRDHRPGGSNSGSSLGNPGRDQVQKSLLGECPDQTLFPPLPKVREGVGERERKKVIASILENASPNARLSSSPPSSPLIHWDTPAPTSILGEAPTRS